MRPPLVSFYKKPVRGNNTTGRLFLLALPIFGFFFGKILKIYSDFGVVFWQKSVIWLFVKSKFNFSKVWYAGLL